MRNSSHLTRREFLRASVCTAAGLCLAACAKSSPTVPTPASYYVANKARIVKELDPVIRQMRKFTAQSYGESLAATMVSEAMQEFERLLPQLPYIGGDKNSLTDTLAQSAGALAFYRVMKAHGTLRAVEETGRIIYQTAEAMAFRTDAFSSVSEKMAQGKAAQNGFKRMATWSQQRAYPDDWVLTFVEGNGKAFDFGVDYTECGIVKFYHAQGADELAPYLCLGDFPISQALGTGLVRTTTLARGGSRCDFRFKNGRPIQMEWTPDFLKE